MVEYAAHIDSIFHSLADGTRRDIVRRVGLQPLSISEIAELYNMSFAAVAKHVKILTDAMLVRKQRKGKEQIVRACPETLKAAAAYLENYEKIWGDRFDALDDYFTHS